jgi:hypothetical protein
VEHGRVDAALLVGDAMAKGAFSDVPTTLKPSGSVTRSPWLIQTG